MAFGVAGTVFAPARHGLEVRLRVTPRAQSARIDGLIADADGRYRLKIAVTEAADRGRANDAVIAALAREWQLPKSTLAIVAGATDRRKTLAVAGEPHQLADATDRLVPGARLVLRARMTTTVDTKAEATRIDGRAIADALRGRVRDEVAHLRKHHHLTPGLAVVLVGDDPASQIYVRTKSEQCEDCAIQSFSHRLPADVREKDLLTLIAGLNQDDHVHGILVQLPLPRTIDTATVLAQVSPDKDVDGFHVVNAGRLMSGLSTALAPCTPIGCLRLIKSQRQDLSGLRAVVVGRSNIVGKPMAMLLLAENCTVVMAHSRTADLAAECRAADILVAAVGRPQLIAGDWIKPGAIVIDVGINRIETPAGKRRLVGDVDFETAKYVAGAITPVPGGVGPMTVACLLRNTVIAACRLRGIDDPII
ncbi:bifunctional methylenetetrahydrofolate dehydrogenase/methenyltetrahydrofolate cyclohydrolase FolD [Defluviicoccus vanus]|nr:bifunctional methylenetetrahydrofolate dehydrogenase/methenyltetrahydrofolate cyclohydrolase FolD [Defluviicoccus vanus]